MVFFAIAPEKAEASSKVIYKLGDMVEYHSSTHNDWLPATVLKDDEKGRIVIDLKPNTWMSPEEQALKIRSRKVEVAQVARPSRSPYPRSGSSPAFPERRANSQEKGKAEGGIFPDIRRKDQARGQMERMPSNQMAPIQRSPSAPAPALQLQALLQGPVACRSHTTESVPSTLEPWLRTWVSSR
eukprot:s186_g6.t1